MPDRAVRAAGDPASAGAGVRAAAVGRRRVVRRAGAGRLAATAPGPAAGRVCRAVPGTGKIRAGHVRGTRQHRRPVGAAPLQRRLVRHRQTPQAGRHERPVPAPQARPGAGPLVSRHLPARRAGADHPGRERLPAADRPAGPGHPLPGRAGPVGDPRLRRGAAVRGRDRRGPGHRLPARAGPGPGQGRRGRPGHHPPLRRRRPGRAGAAGVRAGHPGRMPAAPARPQGPHPRRRGPRPQARAARLPPLAQAPQKREESRGPARPPGPPGPARGRQAGHQLGCGAPDRHPGRRGPARRPGPQGRAPTPSANPGLADRAPDPRAVGQGRGRRDQRAPGRRAGHLLHLPQLRPAGPQARGPELQLPALRAKGPPRPYCGRQHRRPRTGRRHHPRSPARAGDHAPSHGSPPARCAPRAA